MYTTPRIALAVFIMLCGGGAQIVGLIYPRMSSKESLENVRNSLVRPTLLLATTLVAVERCLFRWGLSASNRLQLLGALTVLAFLLTVGAFLLTVVKCV